MANNGKKRDRGGIQQGKVRTEPERSGVSYTSGNILVQVLCSQTLMETY